MAKKQPVAPVVAPEPQIDVVDTALQVGATTEVRTLGSFLTNLGGFLTTARRMETRALETLDVAKTLVKPTSKEEDEAIVATVRLWNAEAKELAGHWDARNVVFTLHKRLIAAFQRAEAPQKAAIEMATKLHNDYVADDKARVRREEQEKREAEEQRQRELRAAELKKLEDEALAAEASSPDLSLREFQFVAHIVRLGAGNEMTAASLSGYKDRNIGLRLAGTLKIQAAIESLKHAAELRKQAAAVVAKPVVIEDVTVVAEVAKAADRTTQRAEVFDEAAFIRACLDGTVPRATALAVLTTKQAAMTETARQMGEAFNRWPGVRLASNTKIR